MENGFPIQMIKEEYITNDDPLFCSSLADDNSQNFELENNLPQSRYHPKKKHHDISERTDPFMSAVQLLINEESIKTEESEVTANKVRGYDKESSKKSKSFDSSLLNLNSCNSVSGNGIFQKKNNNHGNILGTNNPFMSARQVDLQPLNDKQLVKIEVCDEPRSSENESKDKNLAQDDDKSSNPIPKLAAQNIDHQKDESRASKIKPVFGRPNKKSDHTSKISKPSKVDVPDITSQSKKKKKSDSSLKTDVNDSRSVQDSNECMVIDKRSVDISTEVGPKISLENKNEDGKHTVPKFSSKKPKINSKCPPLKTTDAPSVLEVTKDSGNEKLKEKQSLTEISSTVLNSENHLKSHSFEDKETLVKKPKKKKLKNLAEKSDTCSMAADDEEACSIPKKKRKKSAKNSLLDNRDEVENNGPVITIGDNSNQNQENLKSASETLVCIDKPEQKKKTKKNKSKHEVENNGPVITIVDDSDLNQENLKSTPESLVSTDKHEQKKKTKKNKSKVEIPAEGCNPTEKPAKKHKKRKLSKENSDENVMVQMMPPEIVPSLEKYEDEEVINISDESKGSEELKSEGSVDSKSPEKSGKQKEFSVEKENDETKKKESKKTQKRHKEKSEKKCHSSDQNNVQCKRLSMQTREIFDTGTWVQCTNNKCLKWRFLNDVQDPITVPMMWTCSMNSDKEQNDCSYPEITVGENDKEFIFTKYTEGTVVWARVDGYPWWPAMVEMDPDTLTYFDIETEESMYPKYYHVVFFGKKVSRAWVTLSNIAPYTGNRPAPLTKGLFKVREFRVAEDLAAEALDLPINTRLKMFSFSNRYKGFWANCNCKGCLRSMSTVESDNEENNADLN